MCKIMEDVRKEGFHEGVCLTALRMIEQGYDIEEICNVTGLSISEVEALKSEQTA